MIYTLIVQTTSYCMKWLYCEIFDIESDKDFGEVLRPSTMYGSSYHAQQLNLHIFP